MTAEDLPLQFARTKRFSLGVPRGFTVSPDGERVLFVRTASGRSTTGLLWLHENGGERLLADPLALGAEGEVPEAERIRRERARETSGGIVSYATDTAVRLVAFALAGALWTVRTDEGVPRPVPTRGPVVAPRPSPDGTHIAYVSEGALWVVRADGTGDRALAEPEGPEITYGLSDHVSSESLERTRSFWWSPDGSALLVVRVDNTPVQRWYISDPAHPERPPRAVRYPAAGTANARLSLHVVGLDGGRVDVALPEKAAESHPDGAWTDPAFEYVVHAGWSEAAPLAVVQTRDQRSAYLLRVDPATGATTTLHHLRDAAWLEFVPGTPLSTPATGLVLTTQEGTRGLLMTATGVRTPEGLYVHELLGTADGQLYFMAAEEPTEAHVWSYDPGSGFARLTDEPGVHHATVGAGTVVLDSLTPDGRTVTVLRDGVPAGRIRVLAERPVTRPRPRFLTLGERELRAALYLPASYEPGARRLPVIVHSYSGPGAQKVVKAAMWHHPVNQWFADQGFAVLAVDGRGTPGRDRAWETAIHGDQLMPVIEDQADAVRAAAELFPELDTGRVAIRGWSFGGYLAAGAVLHRPDVFHAAVAGAAPTDLRLYDTHWKERFLGHPDVQPDHYERCSLVAHAHKLTRPLMLVHGMADDNVAPAHMLRFSAALLAAGRPHTVLPLAGATHLVAQEGVIDTLLRLDLDFIKKSLDHRTV
ncbi:prolyl oligopeptidase family serine peptidase [Streptomyces sp. BV286]|uniref:S9 family peptidase n=1 Tax=Streptomyces sp. BV286 TaxID=2849672 RepID=UPI001C2E94CB|nr:prolyl oligopeptidase family serine peptidase [Streptomyces sp. BV286]MBV1942490.1 prolyl oligopeptidase family serine peptidase [Streptomyces sp. BV286]